MRIVYWISIAFVPSVALAQLNLSPSSPLNDSSWMQRNVRVVSDEDLWSAIDLGRPGLSKVRAEVRRKDFASAANSWRTYWAGKRQPVYVTQTDHFILDTDLLVSPDDLRRYVESHPEERDTILARAGRILENNIRIWGSTDVAFGREVDFDREPGKTMKYGFHYWFWARPLLMASILTGDKKYLAAFDRLFNRWYEQRNGISRSLPEFDVVYYELGLGIRNRLFIECLLLSGGRQSGQTHLRYLKTFLGAGRWLYELQKREGYRPGNWQVHGSYMLVQLALAFPEFRESAAWRDLGLLRLNEHLEHDFFADGGHSERSPRNYTMATFYCFRNLSRLLEWYGVRSPLTQRIKELAGRTIDWWVAMLAPTGEIPAINDSHRGTLPAQVLREGAEMFGRVYARRILHDLLGSPEGGDAPLPPFLSRHMPASGFTVMRSDWTPDALWMVLNHGPEAGSHSHRDLLDFELYAYGKAFAVDAGIAMTYDDPLHDPWYRSSRAHNMVTVGSHEIARDSIRGEDIKWGSAPSVDFFQGSEGGYRRLGIRHSRTVVFVKPYYWLVHDAVTSPRDGDTLDWNFHSPERLREADGGFESMANPGISLRPVDRSYRLRQSRGWAASTRNRRPGSVEEIDWVQFEQLSRRDSTMEFTILLEPFGDGKPQRSAERVSSAHYVVRSSLGIDHCYIIGAGVDEREISAEGDFLLVTERGKKRRFTLLNGTYLSYRGKVLWKSDEPATWDGEE